MSENVKIKSGARYADLREIPSGGDNVLVVGGGGREHAIVEKLRESKFVGDIYGAPGNDGMDVIETGLSATDIDGIVSFVAAHPDIKLTVVAPDDPLALGLVDRLAERGYPVFGPTRAAAKLEWSKAYAKDFMLRNGIPTAAFGTFTDADEAKSYIDALGQYPAVIKADGLALGKGVLICNDKAEALAAIDEIMRDKKFGAAGNEIVIEQFLRGYEVSLLVFTDGNDYSLMPTSCDHKRALDGDRGLNTGGMGAYSPCPLFTDDLLAYTEEKIVKPTIDGLKREGAPFRGVLYFGLMVGDGVRVLEYNARFGDPETQAVLPLLRSDLYLIMRAIAEGDLSRADIRWSNEKSINVVLASGGYPESYKKGYLITGLDRLDGDARVYFAGVKRTDAGLTTNGGRVLCVQATAADFKSARQKVYDNISRISFENCFYRKDIGEKL